MRGAGAAEGGHNLRWQAPVEAEQDAIQQGSLGRREEGLDHLVGAVAQGKDGKEQGAAGAAFQRADAWVGQVGVDALAGEVIAVGEIASLGRVDGLAAEEQAIAVAVGFTGGAHGEDQAADGEGRVGGGLGDVLNAQAQQGDGLARVGRLGHPGGDFSGAAAVVKSQVTGRGRLVGKLVAQPARRQGEQEQDRREFEAAVAAEQAGQGRPGQAPGQEAEGGQQPESHPGLPGSARPTGEEQAKDEGEGKPEERHAAQTRVGMPV